MKSARLFVLALPLSGPLKARTLFPAHSAQSRERLTIT